MKVIVLGNGVAGNTASSTIRHIDGQADITVISEEAHPEYSACALPHYLAGELGRQKLFLKTKKDYSRERIKTVFGQKVIRISPEEKKVFFDTSSLAYDKLIVATGSRPIIPPIEGINLGGVFTLKSLDDADQIFNYPGKTAVIIGSGLIGVEASVALAKKGLRVYLIELLDSIMPRAFDERPAALLRDILEERGIKVHTGEKVTSIIGNGKVAGIATDKRKIKCDMVILSAGMKPNIELAQKSGLNTGALGGISTNRQMMTSSRDVYAGGDCVETEDIVTGKNHLSLFWHNAKSQGEVIGYNCCGISKDYPGSLNLTSVDILGIHTVSFGSLETDINQGENIDVIERAAGQNYYRLIVASGKLLGAQSIGDARDMGALLSALIKKDDLNEIKRVIKEKRPPLNPLYYRATRFLN